MRKITFTISGLEITATELDDGTILFELAVPEGSGADIRGLFFDINDPALVDNLQITGTDVTNDGFGEVSNLGHGNNMHGSGGANKNGKGGGPYDVGMSFGTQADDDISSTSFVMSSIDGEPLTLDLIANVRFGARLTSVGNQIDSAKVTVIAPAAPDAIDDDVDAVEDTPISFDVVANDTDADGDALEIMAATDPTHGTVEIIGNEIFYTPEENFGGDFDTFDYTITDNAGGMDTATVTVFVEAVADAPTLNVETSAGASVNEIVLTITTALTDTDGSESLEIQIDEDMLPPGATLSRTTIPNPGATEEVILTLPDGASADFDLVVRSISTEASNNDMAETSQAIDIDFQFNSNSFDVDFDAVDRSMWSDGDAFQFTNDTFIGVDTGTGGGFAAPLSGSWSFDIKAGLQSHFELNGGEIDATVPFDVTFDTTFNVTTDVLVIDPSAALAAGGFFLTDGPNAEYLLDFIFDFAYDVDVNLDAFLLDIPLFDVDDSFDNTLNLIDYDSETDPAFEVPIGNAGTLSIQFPELDVAGSEGPLGTYSGDGASNNFLDLSVDIDQVLANLFLAGVNPFGFEASIDFGIAGGSAFLDIIDLDLNRGLNFLQDFELMAGSLTGQLFFEDGTVQDFDMISPLEFADASSMDFDNDGMIEFDVVLDHGGATLHNDTDLGFNVGYDFDILEAGYELSAFGFSGVSDSIGPLFHDDGTLPLGSINVFDETINVAFETEQVSFIV
jgi:hypothetical protein